ncbi:hypothetical protein [Actinophytocola sp.]|jgi:hypothetical protein|uniref:hypothetical protein n=1 Tax=Actinophytocola sp. TaxID=1872138 RepID=UPI002ED9F979
MGIRKVLTGLAAAVAVATGLVLATPGQDADASGKELTHSQAAAKLRAANISWTSSGGCSDRNKPNCTSFTGIKSGTISGIIAFKKSSRCKVTITGGTETGHASGTYSHRNGYKVDIARTTCATNYVKRNFTSIGGGKWRSSAGNVYYDESNHWDITYY